MLGLLEKKKDKKEDSVASTTFKDAGLGMTYAAGGVITSGMMNWSSSVVWEDAPTSFSEDYYNYVKAVQQNGSWGVINLAPPQQQRNPMPASLGKELTELFENTIALLNDKGWVAGTFYSPGQGFCLLGALQYMATGKLPIGAYSDTTKVVNAARMVLGELIYKETAAIGKPTRDIPTWNDRAGRTKEDVILLLKHGIEYVAEHFA